MALQQIIPTGSPTGHTTLQAPARGSLVREANCAGKGLLTATGESFLLLSLRRGEKGKLYSQ